MNSPAVDSLIIIGVGNPMRRDDGVGAAVIAQLEQAELIRNGDAVELVLLDGEPARLIEAWRGRRRAIVIDAARAGVDAGRIHRVDVAVEPLPDWTTSGSSHSAGIAEAVALAKVLDSLPDELVVFGIEPADLSLGEGLSPAVEAALPALVELVIDEAGA